MMRTVKNFNQSWCFLPEPVAFDVSDSQFENITLPHTNKLYSTYFVDNETYQFESTYRKRFTLDENISNKRVFLDFDGVMLKAKVYINDVLLGVHAGGYTSFSFELTQHLQKGENCVTVYVDATEDPDIPPYGGRVDYLTFGGIYRDVYLRIVDNTHIVNAFVRTQDVLTKPALVCDIQLSQITENILFEATLVDFHGVTIATNTQRIDTKSPTITFDALENIRLWSLDNPVHYTLKLAVCCDDVVTDTYEVRFGFRDAHFSKDGKFYLNGEPLNLFGLNRHQTYPYIGAAAPKHLQELDADILKHELGCNIVRTSHYAQSPHFLNRCDEIGLLVFEELAGWQHIGDEDWQALVLQDLRDMIMRDRNHPSIILWGVRVNESPDDETLYTRTNALAHQLDPTRQTGGVRNFAESQFLEDVFTLNDFTDYIQTPRPPHLITEFGGHMYPTKTWDHEARRVEHALKHARKHNLQKEHELVAGAIGWCAFDYHTHKDFGSGDRVCYHGVMDMFRLPKMAAYFYRSQKSPSDEIVLFAATNWTMGDRDGGGNNPLVVFSNCESIEVLIGDEFQGKFTPDVEHYPHLEYPPFTVRWDDPYNPWGTAWQDLTVNGYINGECVATHKIDADHIPHTIRVQASTERLTADSTDMARLVIQIVDKYGNVLPYQMLVATIDVIGDGCVIGENPLVLRGGQGAVFIKAGSTTEELIATVSVTGFDSQSVTFMLV